MKSPLLSCHDGVDAHNRKMQTVAILDFSWDCWFATHFILSTDPSLFQFCFHHLISLVEFDHYQSPAVRLGLILNQFGQSWRWSSCSHTLWPESCDQNDQKGRWAEFKSGLVLASMRGVQQHHVFVCVCVKWLLHDKTCEGGNRMYQSAETGPLLPSDGTGGVNPLTGQLFLRLNYSV